MWNSPIHNVYYDNDHKGHYNDIHYHDYPCDKHNQHHIFHKHDEHPAQHDHYPVDDHHHSGQCNDDNDPRQHDNVDYDNEPWINDDDPCKYEHDNDIYKYYDYGRRMLPRGRLSTLWRDNAFGSC